MANYTELCNQILENVGGKENVSNAVHCMTRLRLSLRDRSKANADALKSVKGVLGAQWSGDQFHVIIGPTVANVYSEFCQIAGLDQVKAVEENLDKKEAFSIKELPAAILNYVSGSVAPVFPILLGGGFFSVFFSIFGTSLLNIIPESTDFMQTLNIVGKASLYFLPVYVSWGAAKKLNTSIPIALILGTLLIDPNILSIAEAGEPFKLFGFLNMPLNNYSSGVLPPLLTVFVMSYVYKFIDSHMPKALKVMAVPFCTLVVMVPLMLGILAPMGTWIGTGISKLISLIYSVAGPVAVALVGALWMFMIATGMHIAVIQMAIINIFTIGNDPIVFTGSTVAVYALIGVALSYFVRAKGEEKEIAGANFITLAIGGLSEPTIFGLLFKNKRAMVYQMIAGGVGALIAGILKATFCSMAPGNLLNVLGFTGGTSDNFVKGAIACALGFVIALVLGLVLGYDEKKEA